MWWMGMGRPRETPTHVDAWNGRHPGHKVLGEEGTDGNAAVLAVVGFSLKVRVNRDRHNWNLHPRKQAVENGNGVGEKVV